MEKKRYSVGSYRTVSTEREYKRVLKTLDKLYHEGIAFELDKSGDTTPTIYLTTEDKDKALSELNKNKSTITFYQSYSNSGYEVEEHFIIIEEYNEKYEEWEYVDSIYAELGTNIFEEKVIDEIHQLQNELKELDPVEDNKIIHRINDEIEELSRDVREERI